MRDWLQLTNPSSHLGGIGLDVVLASSAPDNQADLLNGRAAKRRRCAGLKFHSEVPRPRRKRRAARARRNTSASIGSFV